MADTKISALPASTTPLAGTEVLPIVQSGQTRQVAVADLTAGRAISFSGFTMTGGAANGVVYLNGSKVGTTGSGLTFNGTKLATTGYFNTTGMGIFQGPLSTFDAASGALYTYYSGGGVVVSCSDNSGTLSVLSLDGSSIQLRTGNANRLVIGASDVTLSTGNLIQGTAAKGVNFTANTPKAGMTSQLLNWYEEGTWTPSSGSGITFSSATGVYTRVGRLVTVFATITFPTTSSTADATIGSLPWATNASYTAQGPVIGCSTTLADTIFPYMFANSAFIYLLKSTTNTTAAAQNTYFSAKTINVTMTYMV